MYTFSTMLSHKGKINGIILEPCTCTILKVGAFQVPPTIANPNKSTTNMLKHAILQNEGLWQRGCGPVGRGLPIVNSSETRV